MLQARFQMKQLFEVAGRVPPAAEGRVRRGAHGAAADWQLPIDEDLLRRAFSARRKTLRNALPEVDFEARRHRPEAAAGEPLAGGLRASVDEPHALAAAKHRAARQFSISSISLSDFQRNQSAAPDLAGYHGMHIRQVIPNVLIPEKVDRSRVYPSLKISAMILMILR